MWGYLGVGQKQEPCLLGSKSNIVRDRGHPVHRWDNLAIGPFIWLGWFKQPNPHISLRSNGVASSMGGINRKK